MAQSKGSIPEGAGATSNSTTTTGTSGSYDQGGHDRSAYGRANYDRDNDYDRPVPHNRSVVLSERESEGPNAATIVGAAIAGAIAGAAIPFMLGRRGSSSSSRRRHEDETVEETVTINRPARELYDFWRDFTNFPQFMDNIRSVEKLDDKRSHWVIKAPAGTSVEFDSRIVEDIPGKLIAWESEEGASVPNRGRVQFIDAPGGRTTVRTSISYDPPAGAAGKVVAKLFQRDPATQAREDLRNFKELMEGRAQ
ncbi:MAG TPA: SRPBCC family protein [Allosphingosinicella sp.]|nr:SRPBCC family protein [Allosphingosinicella sp.]